MCSCQCSGKYFFIYCLRSDTPLSTIIGISSSAFNLAVLPQTIISCCPPLHLHLHLHRPSHCHRILSRCCHPASSSWVVPDTYN